MKLLLASVIHISGRAFERIIKFCAHLSAGAIILAMLIVLYGILMRSSGKGVAWTIELSSWGLLFICFLSAAWVLKEEGHVSVGVVVDRFNPKIQSWINITTSVIGAIACAVLFWFGVVVTCQYYQSGFRYYGVVLAPPLFTIVLVIPIGNLLLCAQFLRRAYGYFRSLMALPNKI